MRYDAVELMRKLCNEMGIEWDDTAETLEINGTPIEDSFSFDDLFSTKDCCTSIPRSNTSHISNTSSFTINGVSSCDLTSVNIFNGSTHDVLAA